MSHLDPHAPHSQPTAVYQAVPAAPHAAPIADPTAPPARRSRRSPALLIGLAVVAFFALLSGAFLVGRTGSAAAPATNASATSASATSSGPGSTAGPTSSVAGEAGQADEAPTTVADTPTTVGEAPAGGTGGGAGTGAGSSGGVATPAPKPAPKPAPTTAPAPSAPAPQITSFVTPDSIDCHNDDSPMFSASWTTTNAVKTTIAIDGPGIYKTYGPNGSDSLPFNCSSAHTFKLTAVGQDGKTVSKSITLQPRNVRPPATPDTDE